MRKHIKNKPVVTGHVVILPARKKQVVVKTGTGSAKPPSRRKRMRGRKVR